MTRSPVAAASALLVVLLVHTAFAAPQAQRSTPPPRPAPGRLLVTVADPSGAVIPGATVTILEQDDATKAATVAPAQTSDKSIATFERVALGRYTIQAEFPGFDSGTLKDIRIRSGDNKHILRHAESQRGAPGRRDAVGSVEHPVAAR